MTVRVGLNALFLHYPQTGTGRYLRALIRHAAEGVDYRLLTSRCYPEREVNDAARLAREVATPFDRISSPLAKVWFEQITFPVVARRLGLDVAHVPHFAPSIVGRLPTVVTVHDLIPLNQPAYRKRALYRLYLALVLAGLRSARFVVTDSRASAAELESRARVEPAKLRVVPLGVDERFHPTRDDDEWRLSERLRQKCGIDGRYILCVTGFDRRKNVDRLVEGYARARRNGIADTKLVVVGAIRGGRDLFYDPRPDVERLGLERSVILLGSRQDDEVWALLVGAMAFVFPSLDEGFGLPPLEAMACGTPVACSGTSSLPEVVGDAGLVFDPTEPEAIAEALARLIRDDALRADLAVRGQARAATFTWSATAEQLARIYREAIGGRS